MDRQQPNQPPSRKLPARAVADRYGVSLKTVDRWLETNLLPAPLRINRYRYWDLADLEAFEQSRMSAQEAENAA
jgi:DNA-binding transcriptional MerR regulator